MSNAQTLSQFLQAHQPTGAHSAEVIAAITALADAAVQIARLISAPNAEANLGAIKGSANADGDDQKALDVMADEVITDALRDAGVATYLSEEQDAPIALNAGGKIIVASDPLDGSSNIDTNVSVGTIFSVLDAAQGPLQAGRDQLAAGFFVYGPQTTLMLAMGAGAYAFQMDAAGAFWLQPWGESGDGHVTIAPDTSEFAINAANQRHWAPPIATYIADCLAGTDGPRERNFNMRWVGSLVADAWRIFRRGGVFLYPNDSRKGYNDGRLRLVYEAAPIAFIVKAAGGDATNGVTAILDIVPTQLHQRVPLVFGSANEVDVITGYHD